MKYSFVLVAFTLLLIPFLTSCNKETDHDTISSKYSTAPLNIEEMSDDEIKAHVLENRESYKEYGRFLKENMAMLKFSGEQLLVGGMQLKTPIDSDFNVKYEKGMRSVKYYMDEGRSYKDVPSMSHNIHTSYLKGLDYYESMRKHGKEDTFNYDTVHSDYTNAKQQMEHTVSLMQDLESQVAAVMDDRGRLADTSDTKDGDESFNQPAAAVENDDWSDTSTDFDPQSDSSIYSDPAGENYDDESEQNRTTDPVVIYHSNCASCHGQTLDGGAGPNLNSVGYRLSIDEIKDAIVNGGGGMPGGLVNDNEANILANWLSREAGVSIEPEENSEWEETETMEQSEPGEELTEDREFIEPETTYQSTCAACHGQALDGGYGPELNDIGLRMSLSEIEDLIINGKGSMPGGLVDTEEAHALAKWLSE